MTTVPVIRHGYVQWVWPSGVRPGEMYYMLGDHGKYSPFKYEVCNDPI